MYYYRNSTSREIGFSLRTVTYSWGIGQNFIHLFIHAVKLLSTYYEPRDFGGYCMSEQQWKRALFNV